MRGQRWLWKRASANAVDREEALSINARLGLERLGFGPFTFFTQAGFLKAPSFLCLYYFFLFLGSRQHDSICTDGIHSRLDDSSLGEYT